ncbi:hypothetical protein OCOJLMKI_1994 [Methylobacterium iners]|uniref:Uncharacterized protein n=2 Tax=Methylobacterium iners TaxID=418707 RepID=A0ABQ4RVG6_9HYPH|nr:hypothetical protein OCOJLMKI_1994 [Methylobacterium iners]
MTRPFEITRRNPSGYYIAADPGWNWIVMSPKWPDPQTLELWVSVKEIGDTFESARRFACVRATVPQLKEALQWAADRPIGARLVSVEIERTPELTEYIRQVDVDRLACGCP